MGQPHRARWLLAVVVLSTAMPLLAISESSLEGTITDKDNHPLPGVTLVLRNDTLAFQERGMLTDAQGEYRFAHLPPGAGYRLTVSLPGFATLIFSDISLGSGTATVQNAALHPGSELKEVVRVEAKGETVDTEKVTGSTTFSSTFIAELPILGRDYQDILVLAPGVTDVNHTGNPNIHGARDVDVVTLVDGVSTTDPFTGHFGQNLNIESIQELEVITSAATAQYSRAQGGFANILTKSGGNEFKGTFKMFVRSSRLDGDGAGIEDPELSGGFPGGKLYLEQNFSDFKPFLSLSGAIVRDKLWYYLANEYIHEETPVNALTQAYVTRTLGYREFLKTTWQMSPSNRLALSLILDHERDENQGIASLEDVQSGYAFERGGPTVTLSESSVFGPKALLESSVSWFDNRFSQLPTMNPDTNGNGLLFVDDRPDLGGNRDGVLDANERDPGEDYDVDGFYDVYEDLNHNGVGNLGEDFDYDKNTETSKCEGYHHEDRNCNGYLDSEKDANLNGRLDPEEDTGIPCDPLRGYCPAGVLPGTAKNGKLDVEDVNGNGVLDVLDDSGYTSAPFWHDDNQDGYPDPGEYKAPLGPDMDLITDRDGRTFGPNPYEYRDHRKRITWNEDFSYYIADLGGTHDLKLGMAYEHEGYDSDTILRPNFYYPSGALQPVFPRGGRESSSDVSAILGIPAAVNNTAVGDNVGLFFQDTYKPLPNLTLGLGIRFDRENLSSFGFTPFEPAAERARYDALMNLSGFDMRPYDLVNQQGLCRDPARSCAPQGNASTLNLELRGIAHHQLTRHNLDIDVLSGLLSGLTGGFAGFNNSEGFLVRQPEEFTITNNNLAPRLSLSWDPWGDGKTKVMGSWGRYYGKLFLNNLVLEQGPDTVSRTYRFDFDGVDGRGLPDYRLGNTTFQGPLSATQVDRSLATPYTVEWTAGLEREIAPEISMSLRYISRDFHQQLQDIDLNHRLEIDPRTGQLTDRFGYAFCDSFTNVCSNTPNGAADLYVENFYFNRVKRLGNYNEQTYRAWEIELVRRLKRKWEMEASYTYSKAQGQAESALSNLGDDPAIVEWETGYLDYDQRHVIKLNAVAFLPRDWRLGGTASWESGLPFSEVMPYNDTDDAGYTQRRRFFGQLETAGFEFTRGGRNTRRNHARYLFNTRFMKSFVIKKASASAFFEIYNLLNSDDLRVTQLDATAPYHSCIGPPSACPPGNPAPGIVRLDGVRDFGRRYQVGFQIDF